MSETVRATCPGCQTVLKIPAEWAGRSVKCKRCGAVVKGAASGTLPHAAALFPPTPAALPRLVDGSAAAPSLPPSVVLPPYAAAPVAFIPVAYASAYAPPPESPFAAVATAAADSPTLARHRRKSGRGMGLVWVGLALGLATAIISGVLLAGKDLRRLFPSGGTPEQANGTTPPTAEVRPASTGGLATAGRRFPRRMLVVHVSKYLYCNNLSSGTDANPDLVTVAARRLAHQWRVPTDKDNDQLVIVSDAGAKARPVTKSLLLEAVTKFADTSREQDRVWLYFGGHAIVIDGKAYLAPNEGDLTDAATLVPLDDVFAKLKACKAQQKVIVFDVCRLNEFGDKARPGSEPMGEELQAKLLAAPPGVQAMTTCSAGQNAPEFRAPPIDNNTVGGSLYLSALTTLAERSEVKLPQEPAPADPLPLKPWLDKATERMKLIAAAAGLPAPTPKLAGAEPETVVAVNDEQPPAGPVDLGPPEKGVPAAEVAKLAEPINTLPPYRGKLTDDDRVEKLTLFREAVMKDYRPDAVSDDAIRKDAAKYPLRFAALKSLDVIRKEWRSAGDGAKGLREEFSGASNATLKATVAAEQETPARIEQELADALSLAEKQMDKLAEEKSRYWQVTYLYAVAQLKARLAYMAEYNLALGAIRTDSLPAVDAAKGQAGLILVSTEKMKSKKDVKEQADAARELFAAIAKDYPGTPWAVQAKRHQVIALGLEWKPYVSGTGGSKIE